MLTIRPPLRVTMAWRTVCVVLRTPFRFTAINRSQRAGSLSTKKWSRSQPARSEEHTSELQSRRDLVCRLLLEKKKKKMKSHHSTFHHRSHDICTDYSN